MKFDKYISTTLPYANSIPHVAHALEFVQADAITRFFRNEKQLVFLNVGVDEHGTKVYNKAKELELDTQKYLDSIVIKWIEFCQIFQINYSNFYRTTSPEHKEKVQKFWSECLERGDLYKKPYTGKYCIGCESFKTTTDLVDNKCPDHDLEPILVEEENYFFKISNYKEVLYNWLKSNRNFLNPESKLVELENLILKSEDISVSRLKKNVPWGIEVPDDKEQVIYIWFEALLNYIFAIDEYEKQNLIQICGPDNLKFQGALFQSILLSANLPNTQKLLVHGTILDASGKKMSKTLGNIIDPLDQLHLYGLDAVRYYILAGLSTYGNSSWVETDLIKLYNSELADEFGNLISRVLHLVESRNIELINPETKFKEQIDSLVSSAKNNWNLFEIQLALKETNQIVKLNNKYINDEKPWEKNKECIQILSNIYYSLKEINKLYFPVLSTNTFNLIEDSLKIKKKVIIFKKIEVKN